MLNLSCVDKYIQQYLSEISTHQSCQTLGNQQ